MDLHNVFEHPACQRHFDLNSIFPAARGKTGKTKIFCNAVPAIVGPWRGTIRAWHAPDMATRGGLRKGDQTSFGAPATPNQAAAQVMAHTQTIPQLRTALRRERQLGIAGHPSYRVARHHALREALKAAVGASGVEALSATSAKGWTASLVRSRRGQYKPPHVLH
jgi:hypothetical protein